MDAGWAKIAVDLGQFVILGAIGIHQWLSTRDRVRGSELTKLRDDIDATTDAYGNRLTRLEERITHMPDVTDMAELYRTLNPLREGVARMGAEIKALRETVQDMRRGMADLTNALLNKDRP